VPSRSAALIGDQPSPRFVLAMVGWIQRVTATFVCHLWMSCWVAE
jgi:hypothetical protein